MLDSKSEDNKYERRGNGFESLLCETGLYVDLKIVSPDLNTSGHHNFVNWMDKSISFMNDY